MRVKRSVSRNHSRNFRFRGRERAGGTRSLSVFENRWLNCFCRSTLSKLPRHCDEQVPSSCTLHVRQNTQNTSFYRAASLNRATETEGNERQSKIKRYNERRNQKLYAISENDFIFHHSRIYRSSTRSYSFLRPIFSSLSVKRFETRKNTTKYYCTATMPREQPVTHNARMCTASRTCARAWICVRMKRERECKVC